MITEKQNGAMSAPSLTANPKKLPWLRIVVSIFLSLLGLWFVTRNVNTDDVRIALTRANGQFVLVGLAIIAITMAAKAWRWQLLLKSGNGSLRFRDLFWALSLGQLVNTAIPFVRLGELARIQDLGSRTNESRARALGTLVVEKVLDLITLVLTLGLLLPFLVIPDFVSQSGIVMAIAGTLALLALITVALKTDYALRMSKILIGPFPEPIKNRAYTIIVAGLEGLASLRSARVIFVLLLASAIIGVLSVLTPWVLFYALDIPLGVVPAAAIHVVLLAGTLPPSTPAKVGVFEFLVAFMLRFFGVENSAIIFTYTIVYHLVVVLPQIVFGGLAVARRSGLDHE